MEGDFNPHPPFDDKKDLFDQDESLPEEERFIKITGERYDELIMDRWGNKLNDTPWVIVFLLEDNIDSRRAATSYKSLARRYQGRVRFGYVSYPDEELLSATFEARSIPFTAFIKDGVAYWYRDFA